MPQPTPTTRAAELYLLLLPAGHLLVLPVGGAMATGSDLALAMLVGVAAVELALRPERSRAVALVLGGGSAAGMPSTGFLKGVGLLLVFGLWVAASRAWGYHPDYAFAKGAGILGLALGAGAIAVSGMGWKRAVDAWLGGVGLALVFTAVFAVTGPDILRDRVVYSAGGILGLPFPRISGPLLHPNMLGDLLVVSGVLLWGRWPELSGGGRRWGAALAGLLAVALFLTASTAWIAAGVALVMVGRRMAGGTSLVVRVAGMALAGATLVAVVVPLDVSLLGLDLTTSGIRPEIWRGSLYAVAEAPLLGVGASPYIAEAADPFAGGSVGLWDAHNAYLSVLGQFGLVGAVLAGLGLLGILRTAWAAASAGERRAVALWLALVAVMVHAVFTASEDARHVWALVGLVGLVGATPREG